MNIALDRKTPESAFRQYLLDTALQLFARHGFHAVSLRQLGQAVGIQAGSLYAHIESKDALLQEIIEDGYERLLQSALLRLRHVPEQAGIATFLRHHLSFQHANPQWYGLAQSEVRYLDDEAQQEVRTWRDDYIALFERLLQPRSGKRPVNARTARVARQALRLLDGPPSGDPALLDDCIEDLERLISSRLRAVNCPG